MQGDIVGQLPDFFLEPAPHLPDRIARGLHDRLQQGIFGIVMPGMAAVPGDLPLLDSCQSATTFRAGVGASSPSADVLVS